MHISTEQLYIFSKGAVMWINEIVNIYKKIYFTVAVKYISASVYW